MKTRIRRFHVWNEKREHQGIVATAGIDPIEYPYWEEIETPKCPPAPAKPEWPNGWYMVRKTSVYEAPPLALRKAGEHAIDCYGRKTSWKMFSVIASLGDVNFVTEDRLSL